MEIEIEFYEAPSGKCPFQVWLDNIREAMTRAVVKSRLDRLKMGNFGDCKHVGDACVNYAFGTGKGSEFITPGSAARLFSCFVAEKKVRKTEISIEQRNI